MDYSSSADFKIYVGKNATTLVLFDVYFTRDNMISWTRKNWAIPYVAIAIYLVLIYGLQKYMAKRQALDLRGPLIFWNVILALYSGLLVLFSYDLLIQKPFHNKFGDPQCSSSYFGTILCAWNNVVCDAQPERSEIYLTFLGYTFVLSKLLELGDTLFIVLRKKPLIFLHWYHHVTVLVFAWYGFIEIASITKWFSIVNAFVHTLMYTYFAFHAMEVKVPKCVSMSITGIQILQMLSAICVTWTAYHYKRNGQRCETSYKMINISFAIYLSYFLLFLKFFYDAYIANSIRRHTLWSKTKQT